LSSNYRGCIRREIALRWGERLIKHRSVIAGGNCLGSDHLRNRIRQCRGRRSGGSSSGVSSSGLDSRACQRRSSGVFRFFLLTRGDALTKL
jgi:hypothetical protein